MVRLISGTYPPSALRHVPKDRFARMKPTDKCPKCGAKLAEARRLKRHMRKAHNVTIELMLPNTKAQASTTKDTTKKTPRVPQKKASQQRATGQLPARPKPGKKKGRAGSLFGRPPIPDDVRQAVIARDQELCQICGCKTVAVRLGDPNPRGRHLDHVIPWSKGGKHKVSNLQVLCADCNRRKGARAGKLRAVPLGMKTCLMCGALVRTDQLAQHLQQVHKITGAGKRSRRLAAQARSNRSTGSEPPVQG